MYKPSTRNVFFQGSAAIYNLFSSDYALGFAVDLGVRFGRNFIGATLGGCRPGPAVGLKYYFEMITIKKYLHIDIGMETGFFWYEGKKLEYHYPIGPGLQLKIGNKHFFFVVQNHLLIGNGVADHCNVGMMINL
jgi:hypothetical protein